MIHSGDDIARIFARISESSDREITLESPNRSIVYAPFVLRLILARFPDKRFTLVTADSDLRRIAELLGIRVYTRNESREFEDEFSKSNILRHNFTFLEYFWYEIRKLFSKIRFTLERRQKKNLRFRSNKILAETNLILLVMGVILSLSLLIFIFYFAVSKTTITITPDFAVKTVSQNLIYQE